MRLVVVGRGKCIVKLLVCAATTNWTLVYAPGLVSEKGGIYANCRIVIGSGPAAHTAAVYLARAELKRMLCPDVCRGIVLIECSGSVRGHACEWNRCWRTTYYHHRCRELPRFSRWNWWTRTHGKLGLSIHAPWYVWHVY